MEDLQRALIIIRAHKLITWNKLAEEIGIGRATLLRFVDYKVKPTFLTLARITKFIEAHSEILKQKEIK